MDRIKKIGFRIIAILVFLVIANQAYRLLFYEADLQEQSELINLLREIPEEAEVVYFGESSNFTFGDYDLNTNRISDMISDYYPDISFGTVSHGALHAGNYLRLIKNIPDNSAVSTLIITLNLRSFNAQWIDSKLETSLAKSMVLLENYPPLLKRSVLSFKAYDIKTDQERQDRINKAWKKDEIFIMERGKELTVDQWTEEILALPDSILSREQRILGMHYIRTYAFEIDTLKNPRIRDFDKIVELAGEKGWNLVFNLMAENTEKADQLVGGELVNLMRKNALLLGSRYSSRGVKVVNNLEAVSDPSFLDRNWTTEHYDEKGRKEIAANVAKSLQEFFPGEFTRVNYSDSVKRDKFFNDCEGRIRWFQMGTCTREQSFSGEYSSRINREDPFSVGFTRPVNMIMDDKLNEVSISFQYYQPFVSSRAQVVMELLGGEDKAVWINFHLSDLSPEPARWIPVTKTFGLPDNVRSYKLIKLYIWNPGKEPAFVDDIDIQFK